MAERSTRIVHNGFNLSITFNADAVRQVIFNQITTQPICNLALLGEKQVSIINQFKKYLDGEISALESVAFKEIGTEYQKKVWSYLRSTQVGQTYSYSEVAKAIDSHPRAVGQACRKNPLPLITPCHRIVSINGLGGFVGQIEGYTLTLKTRLLKNEQSFANNI